MRDENSNVEFGNIQVHREAIADLVSSALSEIEGVGLIPVSPRDRFLEFFQDLRVKFHSRCPHPF